MNEEIEKVAKQYGVPEEYICPECLSIMKAEWENNGFTEPEGPSKWEVSDLYCPNCG